MTNKIQSKIPNRARKWTPLIPSSIHSENSPKTALDSLSVATNPIAKNFPKLLSFSFQLTTSSLDLVRMRETTIASDIQVVKQEAEGVFSSIETHLSYVFQFFFFADFLSLEALQFY
ncbi:hypothetical protein P8452_15198 [Trifolium repens]|nr:hypothetical protein P8452_15198 [Trifolium repens]